MLNSNIFCIVMPSTHTPKLHKLGTFHKKDRDPISAELFAEVCYFM